MDMDVDNNIIRGISALSNKAGSRSSLIFSSTSSILYYQCMEINNDILDINCQEYIDCYQLSYERNIEIDDLVRTVTNKSSTKEEQCIYNEAHTIKKVPKPQGKNVSNNNSNMSPSQNIINI